MRNEGEAMGSRYHARVALIYAIETSLTVDGASPEEIEVSLAGAEMGERMRRRRLSAGGEAPGADRRGGAARRLPEITLEQCWPAR